MTRMTGPDCAVMCKFINIHAYIHTYEREQGNIHFPCSADHKQDWQPYSVDLYSCYICDHAYMKFGR